MVKNKLTTIHIDIIITCSGELGMVSRLPQYNYIFKTIRAY